MAGDADAPMFLLQGYWNCVTPLKPRAVFFEVVLFEDILFGTESTLTVPVAAVFVADLTAFALSASIFPSSRPQDANTSSVRKIKDHLLITKECILFPSSQIVLIDNILFFDILRQDKNSQFLVSIMCLTTCR
jgi:hypothetical protein